MLTQTLRPNRFKCLALLLLSCAFVAIGLNMVFDGNTVGWLIISWLSIVFFGLGALVFIVQLLPNAAYLQLDQEGFTVCSLFRSSSYRWSDVDTFEVTLIGLNRMVVFNFSESYHQALSMRQIATAISGYEGALPDSYSLSVPALAALLNEYRNEALLMDTSG